MWYLFGLITLCVFTFYAILMRTSSFGSGSIKLPYQKRFTYDVHKKKSGILFGFSLGIVAQKDYDYSLKTESTLDRFFKRLKLSNEHQIGKTRFDNLVYITSDHPSFLKALSSNEQLSNCIIKVFEAAEKHNTIVKKLRHNHGQLWVKLKIKSPKIDKDGEIMKKISADIFPLLNTINLLLTEPPSKNINKWKDPFILKAAIIMGLSSGLAFNGTFLLFTLFVWTKIPFIIDVTELIKGAFFYGTIFTLILIFITIYLLKRSSRTHLVLIQLIIVGYFGVISTAYYGLRDINIGLDKSKAISYNVVVHKKRHSSGRRSSGSYLTIDDWNNKNKTKEVRVPFHLYKKAQVNHFVTVNQKQGYLGYRWVESIKPPKIR